MWHGVRLPESKERPEVIGIETVVGIQIVARVAVNEESNRVVPVKGGDNQKDQEQERRRRWIQSASSRLSQNHISHHRKQDNALGLGEYSNA